MAAGKQVAKDIVITYDDGVGSPQDISQYVDSDVAIKIIAMLEETDGYGDEWDEFTPTGHASLTTITLSGQYDDTTSEGPAIVFLVNANDRDPQGTLRTLKIEYGNSKSVSVETRLVSYERIGRRRLFTRYEAVIQPSGAVTEV